jgi:hypothetical protein
MRRPRLTLVMFSVSLMIKLSPLVMSIIPSKTELLLEVSFVAFLHVLKTVTRLRGSALTELTCRPIRACLLEVPSVRKICKYLKSTEENMNIKMETALCLEIRFIN